MMKELNVSLQVVDEKTTSQIIEMFGRLSTNNKDIVINVLYLLLQSEHLINFSEQE